MHGVFVYSECEFLTVMTNWYRGGSTDMTAISFSRAFLVVKTLDLAALGRRGELVNWPVRCDQQLGRTAQEHDCMHGCVGEMQELAPAISPPTTDKSCA